MATKEMEICEITDKESRIIFKEVQQTLRI